MRVKASLFLSLAFVIASACGGGAAPAGPAAPAAPAVSAAPGEIVFPKPEKVELKMGHSNAPQATNMTGIMASAKDFYGKYGLKVTPLRFSGAAPAMQALLAGQTDIGDNSAAPVFATVGTSSAVQIVFVTRANLFDNLYAQKDIKTAADLKGKNVAISSFGSNSYAGALQALKALGLSDKDVTLTVVGNDNQRLAALKGGAVAASIQDANLERDLTGQGFNVIVKLRDVPNLPGQPGTSLVVPVDFQKKYPNTTLALVAAQLEAQRYYHTHLDESAEILAKAIEKPVAEAKQLLQVELTEPWTPKDGRCSVEMMTFAKSVAASLNPALANIDPMAGCTNVYLDKLKEMGFQKKIGIPGY